MACFRLLHDDDDDDEVRDCNPYGQIFVSAVNVTKCTWDLVYQNLTPENRNDVAVTK